MVIFVAFADAEFTVAAIYNLDADKAAPINPTYWLRITNTLF
jgi:hypothetical protein